MILAATRSDGWARGYAGKGCRVRRGEVIHVGTASEVMAIVAAIAPPGAPVVGAVRRAAESRDSVATAGEGAALTREGPARSEGRGYAIANGAGNARAKYGLAASRYGDAVAVGEGGTAFSEFGRADVLDTGGVAVSRYGKAATTFDGGVSVATRPALVEATGVGIAVCASRGGVSRSGPRGVSIATEDGTAAAGPGGVLVWWVAVGSGYACVCRAVGEDGIEPGTPYRWDWVAGRAVECRRDPDRSGC